MKFEDRFNIYLVVGTLPDSSAQGLTQAGVRDSQTPDYWQNDAQLYFVRFSVFVESS